MSNDFVYEDDPNSRCIVVFAAGQIDAALASYPEREGQGNLLEDRPSTAGHSVIEPFELTPPEYRRVKSYALDTVAARNPDPTANALREHGIALARVEPRLRRVCEMMAKREPVTDAYDLIMRDVDPVDVGSWRTAVRKHKGLFLRDVDRETAIAIMINVIGEEFGNL